MESKKEGNVEILDILEKGIFGEIELIENYDMERAKRKYSYKAITEC